MNVLLNDEGMVAPSPKDVPIGKQFELKVHYTICYNIEDVIDISNLELLSWNH